MTKKNPTPLELYHAHVKVCCDCHPFQHKNFYLCKVGTALHALSRQSAAVEAS